MEMIKENLTIEEMGQEVELTQLELEDFISGSENGLDLIDKNNNNIIYKTVDEIQNELSLDEIYEVYYIEKQNSVKLLLNNGHINLLIRI